MEIFKLPNGSEKALHYIVNPNIIAYEPLEKLIPLMKLPILIFYGTEDWMCDRGAKRLRNIKKSNYKLFYISDSGHNIPTDNSKDLLNHIFFLRILMRK